MYGVAAVVCLAASLQQGVFIYLIVIMLYGVNNTVANGTVLGYDAVHFHFTAERGAPHPDGIAERIFPFKGVALGIIIRFELFRECCACSDYRVCRNTTQLRKLRSTINYTVEIYSAVIGNVNETVTIEVIEISLCLLLIRGMDITDACTRNAILYTYVGASVVACRNA